MASHFSLWHSDILRFKLAVLVLVAVLLAMHVLTPTSRAVSYGVAPRRCLSSGSASNAPTADASPGKAAGELVRAVDGDSRCTCTKGRASMLTHRGPESSPR